MFAPHYARAEPMMVIGAAVAIRAAPDPAAPATSELACGEGFAVLDQAGGWAWGYCAHDHYVGYVPDALLGAPSPVTHVVDQPAALVFADADIKAPVRARWPLGTRFEATGTQGDFLATASGFVHRRHARPIDTPIIDPVAVAEAMAGTPYRWGGRGGDGIDCSGLVQRAWGLAGTPLPRDSDQQRSAGRALDPTETARRGDLVFLPGHVGIMVDEESLVHATAFWMSVTVEPLATVLARAGMDRPTERRRLP